MTDDPLSGAAPGGVRHRLPHARQRERGGGRRAGGVPPPPPRPEEGERIESPRAYLATVVTRLASTSCARPACGASATSASGCPSRWSGPRTRTRPGTWRWPTRCRWRSCCCSSGCRRAARGLPAARGLRLPYGEIARSSTRARTTPPARLPRAPPVEEGRPRFEPSRRSASELARRFLAAIERGRPRRPRAPARRGRRAARRRRRQGPGPRAARWRAASGWRGRCWHGRARGGALAARPCARGGQREPGAITRDGEGRPSRVRPPDRRRPRASAELGGQPGQARAPRPAHRLRRADQAPELSAA